VQAAAQWFKNVKILKKQEERQGSWLRHKSVWLRTYHA